MTRGCYPLNLGVQGTQQTLSQLCSPPRHPCHACICLTSPYGILRNSTHCSRSWGCNSEKHKASASRAYVLTGRGNQEHLNCSFPLMTDAREKINLDWQEVAVSLRQSRPR